MSNEYQIWYPVTGLGSGGTDALKGRHYRANSIQGTEQSLTESPTYFYMGSVDGTLQPGDHLVFLNNGIPVDVVNYQVEVTPVGGSSSLVVPAGYVGDYLEDDIVYFLWKTAQAPTVDGTVKVYQDGSADEVGPTGTGITDTRNFDPDDLGASSNVHLCTIDLSANTFYSKEADYSVILSGATIDGVSVNAVIATFSIENRYAGKQFIRDG